MRDSVSTPTISTVSARPEPMSPRASPVPNTNPVQAANTSYAAARVAPSFCCSVHAHEGRIRSGVVVARMMWSTSEASTPAISSARWQAINARSLEACPVAAIRRSRMRVRSTIHSSEVSTSFARSAFVSTRSGTYRPVPVIVAPRIPSGRRVMIGLDLLANVFVDAPLQERGQGVDRAPERAGSARAVADEAHAVHPEERCRTVLLPVDARAEPRQGPSHEQRAKHGQRVALDLLAHGTAEERGRALCGLQQYIAGEAVRDDDVAGPREEIAALDGADEVEVPRGFEERQHLLHELVPLALLLADREQPDTRVLVAQEVAGEAGAHVRELDEPRALHLGVGAHVEHHRALPGVGEERGQRGARNALEPAEPEQRARHDCAGVACAENAVQLPVLVALGEHTERGPGLACGHGRLGAHVHLFGNVDDVHERRVHVGARQRRTELGLVAHERQPEAAGPLAERERGALGHGIRAEVASHRINPDARDRGHEGRPPLCFARRNDLFALVESTARTDPVREPRGAAVRAVREPRRAELPVRAPLLAARVRGTSLGNRHDAEPPGAGLTPRARPLYSGRAVARQQVQIGITLRAQARTVLPTAGSDRQLQQQDLANRLAQVQPPAVVEQHVIVALALGLLFT